MEISGIERVKSALKKKGEDFKKDNQTVVVGYTQSYAIPVHENLQAKHREDKQAKYLEGPARRLKKELAQIVVTVYRQTKSMSKALLAAGLRLQRESQEVVPIDTAALKASAFTAYEKDSDAAAYAAFAKSNALKSKVLKRRAKGK